MSEATKNKTLAAEVFVTNVQLTVDQISANQNTVRLILTRRPSS